MASAQVTVHVRLSKGLRQGITTLAVGQAALEERRLWRQAFLSEDPEAHRAWRESLERLNALRDRALKPRAAVAAP